MANTILTNWTVYYSSDAGSGNGYKQIRWTGAGASETNTNTVNELYSALCDLFSISSQNDANDTTPMYAVTPTVYNIGIIDAGDLEAWFIDPVSLTHLTGGSIQTVGWTRVQDVNPGIIKVAYTVSTSQFVASDIGRTVTHISGDTGILLYFANNEAWIRPTDRSSTHNWDTGSGTFVATGGTGNVTQSAAPKTGERLWSNLYTIGSIYSGTSIYVTQNFSKLTSFWSTGHIDRLFLTNDGFDTGLIDGGLLSIYAREYGYTFDHYTIDISNGGRNPVPLSTGEDINNTTLEATIASMSGITFTFGATTKNLNNGNGLRPYDVAINCNNYHLNVFYEYTKYVTRRTSTSSLNGRDGEQYPAVGDIILNFQTNGNFTQGLVITGTTSGATGRIVGNHNSNPYYLVVRDVRGTFLNAETVTDTSTGSATTTASSSVTTITSVKTSPFGTFAGGVFFGARGVWIENMHGDDANNYQLTDTTNSIQDPPVTYNLTINIVDTDGNDITQNCEITIVKNSDSTVLFHEDDIIDGSTLYQYTTDAGTLTYINVLNVAGFQPRTVNNYTLPAGNSTLNIQLDEDRFYNNP